MQHSLHIGLIVLALSSGMSFAQSALPDTENGRYALSTTADGIVRLDTRTGTVSTCKNGASGWECVTTPDERAAFDLEIGRLQAENEKLRAQLEQRGGDIAQNKTDEALPKSDPLVPGIPRSADGERKIEIPLPSDRDVNRFMGFLENAWRRLIDMAARMQRNSDDNI